MKAEELWKEYTEKVGSKGEMPEAWAFGGAPDELLDLVLKGEKVGTASLRILYDIEGEPLPQEGELSIILDSRDRARCIIKTTRVYTVPFLEVTAEHAAKEGEGDKSLAYWRLVHEKFFTECLAPYPMEFSFDMPVVCEEFHVLYSKKEKVAVSACLLGENCKYSGGNNRSEKVLAFLRDKDVVPVCPETMGGLPTPRKPSEIVKGVVTQKDGTIVDGEFRRGAERALEKALSEDVDYAVLQSRSPSCGVKEVYDGTFSGTKVPGEGVFAALLRKNGIPTIDKEDIR